MDRRAAAVTRSRRVARLSGSSIGMGGGSGRIRNVDFPQVFAESLQRFRAAKAGADFFNLSKHIQSFYITKYI